MGLIWNSRNKLLYELTTVDVMRIAQLAESLAIDHVKAQCAKILCSQECILVQIWKPPPSNCLKVNTDASLKDGYQQVLFESESLLAVNMILHDSVPPNWAAKVDIEVAKVLLTRRPFGQICNIPKLRNSAVDLLAKWAFHRAWSGTIPHNSILIDIFCEESSVRPVILMDCFCYESLSSHKFHHKNINCSHNFCMECIRSYIQEKVEQNIATINCPELSCDRTLDPLECQPLIPRKLFIQWCGCLGNLHVSSFRKIYCPYPNCSELILNECDETVKKCSCPRCKRFFCYKCRVPWHAGYWCSESHRERDRNEIQFGLLMEKMKWTRCPACGQSIERHSGCPTVICRCGKSFCHDCGRSSHYGTCRGTRSNDVGACCTDS
ncbi:hypothetical protein BUALT_BualtUnG0061300 [Buddleja alternifolia]|uniref:RBR-type E3 ubiquitin transferase n=1 Tax=Buddleja alternifolia TaxID=168488 RepID=A0AAV6W4H4_9LAMI|nr:hypothetical protein BUALT_BualtUnG0061300 [Buddleja alternifolia]